MANNLGLFNGRQIAADSTMVSPVRRNGEAGRKYVKRNGAALRDARHRKEVKYLEFLQSRRCELVVASMEVGGRWSEEAWAFLLMLAKAKGSYCAGLAPPRYGVQFREALVFNSCGCCSVCAGCNAPG